MILVTYINIFGKFAVKDTTLNLKIDGWALVENFPFTRVLSAFLRRSKIFHTMSRGKFINN